jgi:hypothetical protein
MSARLTLRGSDISLCCFPLLSLQLAVRAGPGQEIVHFGVEPPQYRQERDDWLHVLPGGGPPGSQQGQPAGHTDMHALCFFLPPPPQDRLWVVRLFIQGHLSVYNIAVERLYSGNICEVWDKVPVYSKTHF